MARSSSPVDTTGSSDRSSASKSRQRRKSAVGSQQQQQSSYAAPAHRQSQPPQGPSSAQYSAYAHGQNGGKPFLNSMFQSSNNNPAGPPSSVSDDLYRSLEDFTFGTAQPHVGASADGGVGPLEGSNAWPHHPPNADLATPRASVTSTIRRSSRPHIQPDEDDIAASRRMSRGKIRAVDDGGRRPSLPINEYPPEESVSRGLRARQDHEFSPEPEIASDGELDSDIDVLDSDHLSDLAQDTASIHTFGGGSNEFGGDYSSRASSRTDFQGAAIAEANEDDVDQLNVSSPPFQPHPPGETSTGRRMSVPMNIPLAESSRSPRMTDREIASHRRPSRSLEDDYLQPRDREPGASSSSEPSARGEHFRHVEEQQRAYEEAPTVDLENGGESAVDGFNLGFILDNDYSDVSGPSPAGHIWSVGGDRRPSTMTTGSVSDDPFIKHVDTMDKAFTFRRFEWTFLKERADRSEAIPLSRISSSSTAHGSSYGHHRIIGNVGRQELWRCAYVGRFKVDHLLTDRDAQNPDPKRRSQQRMSARHVPDPYSKCDPLGGPEMVVHRHSRVTAYTIFREHGLLQQRSNGEVRMNVGTSILLASRRVQEQYTSTRTTSKLNSHGLLDDRNVRSTSSATSSVHSTDSARRSDNTSRPRDPQREREKKEKERARLEKEKKEREAKERKREEKERKDREKREKNVAAADSSGFRRRMSLRRSTPPASGNESVPPPPPPKDQGPPSPPSSGAMSPARSNGSSEYAETSTVVSSRAYGTSGPSPPQADHGRTAFAHRNMHGDAMDIDEDQRPRKTTHAETYSALDANSIEAVRSTQGRQGEFDMGGGKRSWWPRFFGTKKANRLLSEGPGWLYGGTYNAPWVVLAPRNQQEEQERVIENLNASFKDVGLLPNFKQPNKGKGKAAERNGRNNGSDFNVFANVPEDALYMLLPMWPGESDRDSMATVTEMPLVPVEDRLYLLVYFTAFEEKNDHETKKRGRAASNADPYPNQNVYGKRFSVCARLIGYHDLKQTGVRLPSEGISVTGDVFNAMRHIPPKPDREAMPQVIAVCASRERGMSFLAEGLEALGLCLPKNPEDNVQMEEWMREAHDDGLEAKEKEALLDVMPLTPIGRAAAEMAWMGCLALTSFGPQ